MDLVGDGEKFGLGWYRVILACFKFTWVTFFLLISSQIQVIRLENGETQDESTIT